MSEQTAEDTGIVLEFEDEDTTGAAAAAEPTAEQNTPQKRIGKPIVDGKVFDEPKTLIDEKVVVHCQFEEIVAIADLNPRRESMASHEHVAVPLARWLGSCGFDRPLVVVRNGMQVLRGFPELAAAIRIGLRSVPVVWRSDIEESEMMKEEIRPDAPTIGGVRILCAFTQLLRPSELKPHPQNPNRHPKEQVAALATLLQKDGFRNAIVTSMSSGYIVKGEGRYMSAKLLQMPFVPVDAQHYDSASEELAALIADNELSAQSKRSAKKTRLLLKQGDAAKNPELFGFTESRLAHLENEELMRSEKINTSADAAKATRVLLVGEPEDIAELKKAINGAKLKHSESDGVRALLRELQKQPEAPGKPAKKAKKGGKK